MGFSSRGSDFQMVAGLGPAGPLTRRRPGPRSVPIMMIRWLPSPTHVGLALGMMGSETLPYLRCTITVTVGRLAHCAGTV